MLVCVSLVWPVAVGARRSHHISWNHVAAGNQTQGPLEEHAVLLTTELSLQPHHGYPDCSFQQCMPKPAYVFQWPAALMLSWLAPRTNRRHGSSDSKGHLQRHRFVSLQITPVPRSADTRGVEQVLRGEMWPEQCRPRKTVVVQRRGDGMRGQGEAPGRK